MSEIIEKLDATLAITAINTVIIISVWLKVAFGGDEK